MNYIHEIRAFYDWLEVNPLPPGSISLWHALMHINNKTRWSSEFTVANMMLQSLTGLSRQGLDRARNDLIQRGLIEYAKGRGNKAGRYKIYSVCNIVGTPIDTVIDTKRTQNDTQSGHSSSTLNKHKHKQKQNIYIEQFEQLWKMYPRKKGKEKAKQKFIKLREKYSLEELLRAVERYAQEVEGKDEQYILHGSTFFNNRYIDYLDENYKENIKPSKLQDIKVV